MRRVCAQQFQTARFMFASDTSTGMAPLPLNSTVRERMRLVTGPVFLSDTRGQAPERAPPLGRRPLNA